MEIITKRTQKVLKSAARPCCLVLGVSSITGLSLVRSLGAESIPVICLDIFRFAIGAFSKYCSSFEFCFSDEELLLKLEEIGKISRSRNIIFCESDKYVLFMDNNRELIEKYFDYTYPKDVRLEQLINKKSMLKLAQESGISIPLTFFSDEVLSREIAEKVAYPSIVKPLYTQTERKTKGEIIGNKEDLARTIKQDRFINGYIIQEVIEGSEDNIWICAGYCDRDTKPLAMFTGYKHRQIPKDFGVTTVAISEQNKVVSDLTLSFLRRVGYRGCFEIEYKKCGQKDEYKFFELNPRVAQWNQLVTSSGVNLPCIAYYDLAGAPYRSGLRQKDGILWQSILDDFVTVAKYYSKSDKFLYIDWLKTIFKADVYGDFSMSDIGPFICKIFLSIAKMLKIKL